jgi:hypothetical protein
MRFCRFVNVTSVKPLEAEAILSTKVEPLTTQARDINPANPDAEAIAEGEGMKRAPVGGATGPPLTTDEPLQVIGET